MNILIFAGGSGTRLWPVSRKSTPKQLLKLIGDKTLLQNTYDRSLTWTKPSQIFIATLQEYKNSIRKQVPQIPLSHYSLEPALRDRGPAIGLAALIMHHDNPKSSFMTMWSDSEIKERKGYFKKILNEMDEFLNKYPESTLIVGIKPTFPHTGLGYIQKGKKLNSSAPLFSVKSFKEKPNLATTQRFIKTKQYLWNSGFFAWKTETLLKLYKDYLPEVYDVLMKIKPFLGTNKQEWAIKKWYPKMPRVEIEQGLIEKLDTGVVTVEAEIEWNDVGSWKVIKDIQAAGNENITKGLQVDHDSSDTLVFNYNPKQLVTTLNTKGLIVVVTPDAILVADKDSSVELKQLLVKLKNDSKFKKYL